MAMMSAPSPLIFFEDLDLPAAALHGLHFPPLLVLCPDPIYSNPDTKTKTKANAPRESETWIMKGG